MSGYLILWSNLEFLCQKLYCPNLFSSIVTFLAESKLGSFWTTLLDAKKQLFVSEKFLNLASEEGTYSLLIFWDSFCMHFCWCNSASSQGLQKSNHAIIKAIILFTLTQEIWQKSSETMWTCYHKKSKFWYREFLLRYTEHALKTMYGILQKSSLSKFYYNNVDRKDLMSIRSRQMILK